MLGAVGAAPSDLFGLMGRLLVLEIRSYPCIRELFLAPSSYMQDTRSPSAATRANIDAAESPSGAAASEELRACAGVFALGDCCADVHAPLPALAQACLLPSVPLTCTCLLMRTCSGLRRYEHCTRWVMCVATKTLGDVCTGGRATGALPGGAAKCTPFRSWQQRHQ